MPPNHPLRARATALSQSEYDPRVLQAAAQLLIDVPLDLHGDPSAAERYLSEQVLPAYLASRFACHAKAAADREMLPAAEAAVLSAGRANDEARDGLRRRRELPDVRVVVGDGPVTYAHNRENLAANTYIAQSLRSRGFADLLAPKAHRWALLVAIGIALVETAVTSRLFNISLVHFQPLAFLAFLGFTALEVAVTIAIPGLLVGPKRRVLRERTAAARLLNTAAAAEDARLSTAP